MKINCLKWASIYTTIVSIILMLCSNEAKSQQWTAINSGSTVEFESIEFLNATTGYIGGIGYMLKSIDGGTTWTATGNAGTRNLDFGDASYGYVAGISGSSMYKTLDGGATWSYITAPTTNSLWGVSVINSNTAYWSGTGGVVWKTTDGGASVVEVNIPTSHVLPDIFFLDEEVGITMSQVGDIYKTTNGGITWVIVATLGGFYTDLMFVTPAVGYACGAAGKVAKTIDGGDTWTTIAIGTSDLLFSVDFFDENVGIAVGIGGVMLKTLDGGDTWCRQIIGDSTDLACAYLLDENTAVVGGDDGVIYRTTDFSSTTGCSVVSSLNEAYSFEEESIKIYPNPCSSSFTLEKIGERGMVEIYNQLGQKVHGSSVQDTQIIDSSEWPSGMYFAIDKNNGNVARFEVR